MKEIQCPQTNYPLPPPQHAPSFDSGLVLSLPQVEEMKMTALLGFGSGKPGFQPWPFPNASRSRALGSLG